MAITRFTCCKLWVGLVGDGVVEAVDSWLLDVVTVCLGRLGLGLEVLSGRFGRVVDARRERRVGRDGVLELGARHVVVVVVVFNLAVDDFFVGSFFVRVCR